MPESASVYEAVYRYATIENAEERARVVSQLIAPMVARIRDNPMGISVNEDPAAVLESDVTFSEFLQSASRQEHWMQLPCSALRLRPGLFSALDSMFGGFADATLIKSDCENMTPPLPALEQLRTAAIDAQPVCVGTIRYALAREFDKRYVAILLHRMELLKDDTPQNPTERKRLVTVSRFMAQHQTQVDAATLQMTAYYAHGFGVSPKLAERHATRAVQVMVGQAYQLCITG
ncbi:hypothetical protein C7419_103583 [Cupriavidus plantarum]|uniref:Uncharacterized protein n=2 Tax=Cupriavidus plantarum TaxID=942865 RepID=A0A316FAK0_9BURK|nr:hypothetical protein C7419_103583 [Cupriavidus plantarum]